MAEKTFSVVSGRLKIRNSTGVLSEDGGSDENFALALITI
jgi:hypothetical protein